MTISRIVILTLLFTACSDDAPPLKRILPQGDAVVLAVAGDFDKAGILSAVSIPSLAVTQRLIDGVASSDPKIRKIGDRVFIINRTTNNVVVLDAQSGQFLYQIATGDKSNPQDVAVRGDKMYVAALGSAGVLEFDLKQPNAEPRLLDLSFLDTEDGLPECQSVYAVANRLVVTCGVLDKKFAPRGKGKAVIFDLDKPESKPAAFELSDSNPFGWLEPLSDGSLDLVIGNTPSFADFTKGCLDRILVNEKRAECLVTNEAMGGYAASYQRVRGGDLLIAVTTAFDDQDFGAVSKLVSLSQTFALHTMEGPASRRFDLATCPTGHVIFAQARAGLRVIDPTGVELTTKALDIGLAPVQNGLVCY